MTTDTTAGIAASTAAPATAAPDIAPARIPADTPPADPSGPGSDPADAADTSGHPAPLRRNRRYQALWAGAAGSSLATMTLDVAIPVLVLAVTGSAVAAGGYGFIEAGASVAAAIPGGALLDRYNRRLLLISADGVRAVTFGLAALILLTGHLALPYLLAVAAVSGAARSVSGAARVLATRAVVPKSQLTTALAQEQVRSQAASILGPALAGVLYAAARSLPLVGAAFGYLLAAVAGFAAPDDRSASRARRGGTAGRGGAGAALRLLLGNPVLRACLVACALINIGGSGVQLTVVVLIRAHGGSAATVGFAFALASAGGLLGTLLIKPLHAWLRPGAMLIALCGWAGICCAALVLPLGPWWYGSALALSAAVGPALVVLLDVLIFRRVDDALRGRAVSAAMVFLNAGVSLGPLTAGVAIQCFGAEAAVAAFSLFFVLAAGYAAANRTVRTARWPKA